MKKMSIKDKRKITQPHKTGSIRCGLHPFIYYEMSLSLVDVGSPTTMKRKPKKNLTNREQKNV